MHAQVFRSHKFLYQEFKYTHKYIYQLLMPKAVKILILYIYYRFYNLRYIGDVHVHTYIHIE